MNKNEKLAFLKGKGASAALVVCFIAVIAMVGAFTYNNYQKKMEQQLAKAEEQTKELTKENSEATTADDIVLPETKSNTSDAEEKEDEEKNEEEISEVEGTDSAADVSTAGNAAEVWFSEESTLEWPASGAVLINYSMDQTVFFSTLEQYKYNPALIIGGEVGEEIAASAAGIVTKPVFPDPERRGTSESVKLYGRVTVGLPPIGQRRLSAHVKRTRYGMPGWGQVYRNFL